jgi:hypothetical protein
MAKRRHYSKFGIGGLPVAHDAEHAWLIAAVQFTPMQLSKVIGSGAGRV